MSAKRESKEALLFDVDSSETSKRAVHAMQRDACAPSDDTAAFNL